jgi:hypothetical protein
MVLVPVCVAGGNVSPSPALVLHVTVHVTVAVIV